MRIYILAATLLVAAPGEPPDPTPESPSPERRVDIRFQGFQLLADRMVGRIDERGIDLLTLLAAPDRLVELRGPSSEILVQAREATLMGVSFQPGTEEDGEVLRLREVQARWAPARPLPRKVDLWLGKAFRLTADALELRRKPDPQGAEDAPGGSSFEAKGRIRMPGEGFSLTCEEIRCSPEKRRIILDRVSDVQLRLADRPSLPPIALSTERLDLEIDLDLPEPYEVILTHPERFKAKVGGARLRLQTLTIRLTGPR